MPGRRLRRVSRSAGPRPGAWGGYSVRRAGRLVEVAMGLSLVRILLRYLLAGSAYQAMDLSRLKRMARPRAAARRMAQVSVERWREGRVRGVDMWSLLKGRRDAHEKMCGATADFFKEG